MRVAIAAVLIVLSVAGFAVSAHACPVDTTASAAISHAISAVGHLLGLHTSAATPPTPQSSTSSSTTNTFVTNVAVTNVTGATNSGSSGAPGATNGNAVAAAARNGGNGGGGGGLAGLSAGGFAGSNGANGLPHNPSTDFTFTPGASGNATSSADATPDVKSPRVHFAALATDDSDAAPLTNGVAIAALPSRSGEATALPVGMASPAMQAAAIVEASNADSFGARRATTELPPPAHGWSVVSALLGLGITGAGLAWRSLMV